jgi:hypothetical protein
LHIYLERHWWRPPPNWNDVAKDDADATAVLAIVEAFVVEPISVTDETFAIEPPQGMSTDPPPGSPGGSPEGTDREANVLAYLSGSKAPPGAHSE